MKQRIVAAALGAAILTVPAAALADSGHSKSHEKPAAGKKVTFVFKGVFTAPGTLEVRSGNAHVRKGGFVGQTVNLDLSTARVVAADGNGDQKVDLTDVGNGDVVLVQARVRKGTKYVAPAEGETAAAVVARKLVDLTHPPAGDE
jgi:hypothetical protein